MYKSNQQKPDTSSFKESFNDKNKEIDELVNSLKNGALVIA